MKIEEVRELAEKVMGWKCGTGGTFHWRNSLGLKCTRYEWHPLDNPNEALMLIEALRAAGWRFDAVARNTYWVARFYAKDDDGPLGDVFVTQIGKTFCEAVCNAALAAVRSKP